MRIAAARGAFVLWAVGVAYVSLVEDPEKIRTGLSVTEEIATLLFGDERHSDKVGHFLAYLGLGALAGALRLKAFDTFLPIVILLGGYGALLEIAQGLGGVRHPDIFDALVNLAGAATGAAPAFIVRFRSKSAA